MIITTRHGFKFSIESFGFSGKTEAREIGEAYIESAIDRMSAATVAKVFGADVAEIHGQCPPAHLKAPLYRVLSIAAGRATKGWHRPDEAGFMVSAWIDLDNA
jgi:hypothetical protein